MASVVQLTFFRTIKLPLSGRRMVVTGERLIHLRRVREFHEKRRIHTDAQAWLEEILGDKP